jgi:RNA polymerase sigma-70 factor (ECF subfamily)
MLLLQMSSPAAHGILGRPVPAADGFAAEVAGLRPLVRAVVARVLSRGLDNADVEDCTSETLRRAIEGRARLRPGEPVRPWLVGIARHVALDAVRARRRAPLEASHGEDDASPLEGVADPGPSQFDRLAQARRDHAVRDALGTLPEGARLALTYFHLEGLGYQEIAARMNVPLGTVATWISRGRKAMAGVVETLGAEVKES